MAITKNADRQYPLVAKVSFTYADFTGSTGVGLTALDMPGSARIIGGALNITTVFDSATSDTIDVGDGTTAARYLAALDVTALGRTVLVPDQLDNDTSGTSAVFLEWTGVGAVPSAGAGFLEVEYVMSDRANEVQPT